MLRLTHWADDKCRAWSIVAEYRDHVSSAKPSVTGYVSACCGTETRIRRGGDLCCIHCGKVCATASRYSSHANQASRGGWKPGVAETRPGLDANGKRIQIPTGRTWNVIYVNETKSRNTSAAEVRLGRHIDNVLALADLIEPRPRAMTKSAWLRSLSAWRCKVFVQSYADVAEVAHEHGESPILWTAESVRAWVNEARDVVIGRKATWERAWRIAA